MKVMINSKAVKSLEAAVEKGNIKSDGSLNVSGGTQLYLHQIKTMNLSSASLYIVSTKSTVYTVTDLYLASDTRLTMMYSSTSSMNALNPIVLLEIDSSKKITGTKADGTTVNIYSGSGTFMDTVTKL
jgi:hypothetical protein